MEMDTQSGSMQRIKRAFGEMPYGSAANFHHAETLTLENIAENLERLRDTLKAQSVIEQQRIEDLREYEAVFDGLRRFAAKLLPR